MKNSPKKITALILIIISISVGISLYYFISQKSKNLIHYTLVSSSNQQYSYPKIIDYPDKEIMGKVNTSISESLKDQGCGPSSQKENTEWNVKTSVDYAQNEIFSLNASGNYDCGGPYPTNNYSDTLTFNMKNGERINFEKLFTNYERDKKQIIDTIYGNLTAGSNECDTLNTKENIIGYSQTYRLSSTSKAIDIRPDYPHVIESCTPEITVPIKKLLPFTDHNSILNRI